MTQKNFISIIRSSWIKKRRGGAEVISSILLVAITVVGAAILTTFLDETFVSGSMGAASGSDSQIKSLKVTGFDSRDGTNLMGITNLNNTSPTDQKLCRNLCVPNESPLGNGTEFIVIQIENKGVNPVFLHNVNLDGVKHVWDSSTSNVALDITGSISTGDFPGDGRFSILSLSNRCNNLQCDNNQILNGERVNLIVKLDHTNDDIPLSKSIRAQFNIGENTLTEFLIESGGAQ